MREITLAGRSGGCRILLGEQLTSLQKYSGKEDSVIITDRNLHKLYADKLSGFKIIALSPGEKSKDLAVVSKIYKKMLESGLERKSMVIGLGGGVVCDIAGFVASTYMRGIRLGLVPTTLLAQADASIGGKNGVNVGRFKNIVGTITQPEFCLIDFAFIRTLPSEEIGNGLAEIIKHGIIAKPELVGYVEKNHDQIFSGDEAAISRIVQGSIEVKSEIVSRDEFESGERMFLNFGHTVGHAIEKVNGMAHGKAISIGMVAEARISMLKNGFSAEEFAKVKSALESANLPIKNTFPPIALVSAMRKDKKNLNGEIRMALLERLGKPKIQVVGEKEIMEALRQV